MDTTNKAVRDAALEEAAYLCECIGTDWLEADDANKNFAADYLAKAIRALTAAQPHAAMPSAGLAEDAIARIARNYFSEQWAQEYAQYAIRDSLAEAAAPPSPQPVAESAFDEFNRLRKLPKVLGYCAGTLHTEREAFDLAVRNATALQPVAGLTDAEISYELVQDDMVVAATSGFGAEREIRHYAAVYGPDGPVEILKVTRSRFDLFGNAGATGESK